ncbi:adenylate/guanylate cyclase domain-containing protein [Pseudochryseolinea flava]|nr:adenylate/guanylate cyclase domain-containing protein [Pseudochryseolinea flava]
MFADMAGYTAIMQENEQLARVKRKRFKEVLDESVLAFQGRIHQNYGDGSLIIFNSAIQAVLCSIAIQTRLQESPRVDVRIGVHTGEVIIEDETIYGDGVNIAARVESTAVPGSILVSEKVFDEIKNQEAIKTHELGYFEYKNVKHPVRVFAIANRGIVVPGRDLLQGKLKAGGNRIAVLPFVNMSADPENEYFSDGITEELLNALVKIDNIQVTSRTSSFYFKGKNIDIRDIGIQLNVDKILEGSVRKAGNRVRVTAQLINAADGYHIWSENYDRDLHDIFALQDEISMMIANKCRENLSTIDQVKVRPASPVHGVEAYTAYLRGLHYWNKVNPADARQAIVCFQDAVRLEPDYAQAHAMIAIVFGYLGSTGQMQSADAFNHVHRHADLALRIDPQLPDGHIAKGTAYLMYDWHWKAAHDALHKAIALNPAAITAYNQLAFYYVIIGDKQKALEVMETASQLDPLSPFVNHQLANMYVLVERYDEAIERAEKLLEINPTMRAALDLKGWALVMKGQFDKALPIFQEVHRLVNHPLKALMGLGYCYALMGERDKAMDCVHKIEQRQREEPDAVLDGDLIGIWYGLGDYDKVFHYINECIRKRISPPTFFLEYPPFKSLKNDPRYEEVKRKIMGPN